MYLSLLSFLLFYDKYNVKLLTTIIFFVLILILQLLKFTFSTYIFYPTFSLFVTPFYFHAIHRALTIIGFVFRPLITVFRFIKIRLQLWSISKFVKLSKSPYADSYWFLYSNKLTFTTQRMLPLQS